MKNNYKYLFSGKSRTIQFVALAMIACVGIADVSLYMNYAAGVKNEADDRVITETHEMETVWADGEYTGDNTETNNGGEEGVDIPGGRYQFNILEIIPDERKGIMGYTAAGCEPFDVSDSLAHELEAYNVTVAEMREAYMDALVNPNPGSSSVKALKNNQDYRANDQNLLYNYNELSQIVYQSFNGAFSDSGSTAPLGFETEKEYSGIYKYVGSGNGFFAEKTPGSKNGIMVSKFYKSSSNNTSGSFDYIFAEGQAPVYDDNGITKDIKVTNTKRIKYYNNDKFIKDCLKMTTDDAYKKWKYGSVEDGTPGHVIDVMTRTPRSVSYDDIERADIIFINGANKKDYYKYALNIYNLTHGKSKDDGIDAHFYSPENETFAKADRMDFIDFEKVIRIYERIVVRNDCAIVVEKNCCTTYTEEQLTKINTNLRKLMYMLFYIKQGDTNMAGRDLFADYFKRYTDCPGEFADLHNKHVSDPVSFPDDYPNYAELRKLHLTDPENYPVDYRATSLIRNNRNDPTRPDYYYMHAHAEAPFAHVGHPLVIDINSAITGIVPDHYVTVGDKTYPIPKIDGAGYIVAEHDPSKVHTLTLKRWEPDMFRDAGLNYKQKNNIYSYEPAYESMSNTTDYIYIDNDGRLIIDTKYSSDQNYNSGTPEQPNENYKNFWYRIDADGEVEKGQYATRRRKWGPAVYDEEWPWNRQKINDAQSDRGELTVWLMHRQHEGPVSYDCNMHMWYDYYQLAEVMGHGKYTNLIGAPPFDQCFDNQSLMQENGLFKEEWIYLALSERDIKREFTDKNHTADKVSKKYYTYLSIQNGDGVNDKETDKNKTLYYNEYESSKISSGATKVPIKIKVKSSCKLENIKVYYNSASDSNLLVTYNLNQNVSDASIDKNGVSSKAGIEAGTINLTPNNNLDADNVPTLKISAPDNSPIYTYEGYINANLSSIFLGQRNSKFIVELNVIAPNGARANPPRRDEITVVKRDFFMLN